MEHLVREIYDAPGLAEFADESPEEADGDDGRRSAASERSVGTAPGGAGGVRASLHRLGSARSHASLRRRRSRPTSTASRASAGSVARGADDGAVAPDMESRFFGGAPGSAPGTPGARAAQRLSDASLADLADRHLRDKTDAIAHIIRSISDQCAAAVEGLQLAHGAAAADAEEDAAPAPAVADADARAEDASDAGTADDDNDAPRAAAAAPPGTTADLHPDANGADGSSNRASSSVPPTPDLDRSSTALSMTSVSTAPEHPHGGGSSGGSTHRASGSHGGSGVGLSPGGTTAGTKIVEEDRGSERGSILHERAAGGEEVVGKGRPAVLGAAPRGVA